MSESNFASYPPLFRPSSSTHVDSNKPTESLEFDSGQLSYADIPVIDLECMTTTTTTSDHSCKKLISEACRDWGLFRLVNHGIPVTLLSQIQEHAEKLFSMTYESKKDAFPSSTNGNNGSTITYFWGTPALTPSGAALALQRGPKAIPSLQWMEGFNIPLAQVSDHLHYQDSLLQTFRCLLEEYGKHQARLATSIFKALASDLNLGPLQLSHSNYLSIDTGLLRVYRYPRCPDPDRSWGIDVHTDSSALSILHQDEVGGLQIYKDEQWLDVKPISNTLIVNIGDMLQAMSDDKYISVKHRVKVNKHKERISIGYFVFPAEDAVIQSTKYKPFTYADFRAQVQHDLKTVGLKIGLQNFKLTNQNF